MKLKYLLPVATIASVAAIAAPLVTSCGKNKNSGNTASWRQKDGEYTPKLRAKSASAVKFTDADELTEAYRNDLSNTPLIYADDIVNYLSLCYDEETFKFRYVEYTFNEVSATCEDAPTGELSGRKMFRISFDMKIDASLKIEGFPFEYDNRTVVAKNIPVLLDFSTNGSGALIKTSCADMDYKNDAKWSIEMPEVVFESGSFVLDDNITYNKEKLSGLDPYVGAAVPSIIEHMVSCDTDMISGSNGGSHYYMYATKTSK